MKKHLPIILAFFIFNNYFTQDVKDGLITKFYKNGNPFLSIYYENGVPNGIALVYDSLGKLKESGYFFKDRWVGNYNEYHKNGFPKKKYIFGINGKRMGLSTTYHQNGLVEAIVFVLDGKQEGLLLNFDSTGKQTGLEIYTDGIKKKSIEQGKIEPYRKILIDYVTSENLPVLRLREIVVKQKEIAKKETEITNKELVLAQERQTRNYILIGMSLISALLIVIVISLIKNKKANKLISMQKREVEQQKHIIEEKQKEILDSINYAERIQRSFLASSALLEENLKNYFVYFKPKDVVSGDFYWADKLDNGNFLLATADSTGHGVPGAIMSLLNITSLESAIKEGCYEPAEILNHTRQTIINRLKQDGSIDGGKDGMDASLLCFDFKNGKLTYAAANNPVWVIRHDALIELNGDKMPVGKHDRDQIQFTQNEFDLIKGDIVYTLTDGYPDQFGGPKGKKFMYKQLKELLTSISGEPLNVQKEKLDNTLATWMNNVEQVDDITIIGIKI